MIWLLKGVRFVGETGLVSMVSPLSSYIRWAQAAETNRAAAVSEAGEIRRRVGKGVMDLQGLPANKEAAGVYT